MTALFDPAEHEPFEGAPWSDDAARAFVDATLDEALAAAAQGDLWPVHPEDADPGVRSGRPATGIYVGAAGMLAALATLDRDGVHRQARAELARRAWAVQCAGGQAEDISGGSYMLGSGGVALAAAIFADDRSAGDALAADAEAMIASDGRELFAGGPGFMLATAFMARWRTREDRWPALYAALADALTAAWDRGADGAETWEQHLYGQVRKRFLGAAHGFAGNAAALLAGARWRAVDEQEALERRIVAAALGTTRRDDDGRVTWPVSPDDSQATSLPRMQWCHGAPGMVTSLAALPAGRDAAFDAALTAAGEAIWLAGPIAKNASLCHGAAGNGYALLVLAQRTGDASWLERAQTFAMHALRQTQRQRERFGVPWFTLWTGDLGVACFVDACRTGDPRMPTIDTFGPATDERKPSA